MEKRREGSVMKILNIRIQTLLLVMTVVFLLTTSCADVKNTTSYAVVAGHILVSPTDLHGVEGVTVWIESDSESDLPYYGGDMTVTTDAAGEYVARIFLGFETQEDALGGFSFDPEQPQYVGDARVIFFFQDMYLDIGGGISLELGKPINLPTFYLTQFTEFGGPPE
jgi:hypothetical protein